MAKGPNGQKDLSSNDGLGIKLESGGHWAVQQKLNIVKMTV